MPRRSTCRSTSSAPSSLLRSSGVVGALTLLSRLLGFVREIMLATALGAGGGMDAFLVALMIPNFGRRMFAEGAFSQAFVPVFTESKTTQPHEVSRDLVAVVAGTLGVALALITVIGCLGAPVLVWLFASGFGSAPAKAELAASLLRWTFPYLMFISLTSMAGGVLNTYHRFAVPALTPVILNLCLIASAFIDSGSVQALAYAVFVAGLLQLLFQMPSLLSLRLLPWPRISWRDPQVRKILKLMAPVMLGSSIAQISLLINQNLSTQFGDGSVSWLYYANRLMEFPLGIFVIAIGTAILPALSAHHAVQSGDKFSATLDWSIRLVLLVGAPAAIGMGILAGPIVAVVYGHGRFSSADVRMTEAALWAYSAGFLGFSLVKVLVPGFYARQETRLPVRYAMIALGFGLAFSAMVYVVWRRLQFPGAHVGLAISSSLTAWVNALLLLRRLFRDGIYRPAPRWARFALLLLLANAAMAVVILMLNGDLAGWLAQSTAARALHLCAVMALAIIAYVAVLAFGGLRPRDLRPATS